MTITVASKTDQNLPNGTSILFGLVGMWHFDEGTGVTAHDASASANTGTTHGSPTWVAGKFGKALQYASGSSQYVSTTTTNFPSGAGARTVSLWVYPTSFATANRVVFSCGAFSAPDDSFGVGYDVTTGNLQIYLNSDTVTSALPLTLNQWNFVVVTYSGSGTSFTVYVNGSSASISTAGTPNTVATYSYIGTWAGSNFVDGDIDEVRIYTRALSSAEVAQLYSEGAPCVIINNATDVMDVVPLSGAVGIWHLDENTGVTVYDASLSANTGTAHGTPTPTWVAGKFGSALSFNLAYGQYVDALPYSLTAFSVSAWFQTSASTVQMIAESGTGTSTLNNFCIYMDAGGTVYGQFGDGASMYTATSLASKNDGLWHLVTLTYDDHHLILYIDGALQNSTSTTAIPNPGAGSFFIGTDYLPVYGGHAFTGVIDEVRIYNRGLSATEVTQLYNEGLEAGDFIVESLLDLSNMASGDTVTVTEYISVDDVNSRIYQQTSYSGVQGWSLLRFHGKLFYKSNLYRVTLKQTAGIGRSYPVSTIMQVLSE